jgi:hypothetical protein
MLVRSTCIAIFLGLVAGARAGAAEAEFLIEIKNHAFIPAVLQIPAHTKVRIVVDNQQDELEEFESYALNREKHIQPRSRVTLFIGPLEPGRYLYQGENHSTLQETPLGVIEAQ